MEFLLLTQIQEVTLIALLGLVFGSFTSLITYRITTKDPIVFTRSKCPHCLTELKFYNLIPLFSWIFQGGKCSKCKSKISIRYPLIEVTCIITFLIGYFTLGQKIDLELVTILAITGVLIFMCIVDLEHYYIPDISQFVLAALIALLLINGSGDDENILKNFIPAFAYLFFGVSLWLFFRFAANMDAIGIDDLKFFFIAGFALGFDNFLSFTLLSGTYGAIFGSLWQYFKNDETFPFAPSICLAFYSCLLFGEKLDLIEFIGNMIF